MIYRKLFYAFLLLSPINTAYTQTEATRWRSGFTLGGGVTAMQARAFNNNSDVFISSGSSSFGNVRTWKFNYKPSFAIGFFTKRMLGDRYAIQGECNIISSRQTADLIDAPPSTRDPNIFGTNFTPIETRGSIKFDNIYIQIPLVISMLVDESTSIEGGLAITRSLAGNNSHDLMIATTSGFDPTTGRPITFNPPRLTRSPTKLEMSAGLNWLLGIQHNINDKFALRLRYEGGMTGISDFKDLRENRILIGVGFRLNKS
jgi:Outer membrane protein beta-barrel domain